jgi:hypothetical protein
VNDPLYVKENYEHALDSSLHLSRFFGLGEFGLTVYGLRRTFFEICTKFDAVPLSDPLRNRISPDTQLQIKGRKEGEYPPSCENVYTLTPKIC